VVAEARRFDHMHVVRRLMGSDSAAHIISVVPIRPPVAPFRISSIVEGEAELEGWA
jgi:hypothetical protein